MGAEFIREWITPEQIADTACRVLEHRCQCCGVPTEWCEAMVCGHYICELCIDHEHDCIACALAT